MIKKLLTLALLPLLTGCPSSDEAPTHRVIIHERLVRPTTVNVQKIDADGDLIWGDQIYGDVTIIRE